jgi:hypothetical protein
VGKPGRQARVLEEQAPREARAATPEEVPVPEALVVTEPGEPRVVTAAASADAVVAVPADAAVVEPGQVEAWAVAVVAVERPAPAAPRVRPVVRDRWASAATARTQQTRAQAVESVARAAPCASVRLGALAELRDSQAEGCCPHSDPTHTFSRPSPRPLSDYPARPHLASLRNRDGALM